MASLDSHFLLTMNLGTTEACCEFCLVLILTGWGMMMSSYKESVSLRTMVLSQGLFPLPSPPREHLALSGDTFGCHNWEEMLPASSV